MAFEKLMNRVMQPELLVLLLAFTFNTTWEFVQDPFYAGLAELPHAQVRVGCLIAAGGDTVIALISYYSAAFLARSRYWFLANVKTAFIAWFAAGLSITVALELHATQAGRWVYGPMMPAFAGVGLVPIAQWIVIPAIILVLLRGQRHPRQF